MSLQSKFKLDFQRSFDMNFIRFLLLSALVLLVCLPSQADTQLNYDNDFSTSAELPRTRIAHAYFHNIKVNSDLIDDFCYLDSENHTLSCSISKNGVAGSIFISKVLDESGWYDSYMMADINNDGRADFCQLVYNRTQLQCYVSKGEEASLTFEKAFTSEYLDGGWPGYRWLVDVDGDGRADFCRITGSSTYYLQCRIMGNSGLLDRADWSSAPFPSWPVDKVMHWFDSSGDGQPDLHGFFQKDGKAMLLRFKNSVNEKIGFTNQSTSIILSQNERVGTAVTNAQGPGTGAYCYLKNGLNLHCEDINAAVLGKTKIYADQMIDDTGWVDSRAWIDVNSDGLIDYCALVYANTQMSCWLQSKDGKFQNSKSAYIDGGYNWYSRGTQSSTGMADTRAWVQVDGIYKAFSRLVYANGAYRLNILDTFSDTNQICKVSDVSTRVAAPRILPNPPLPEPTASVVYRYDERDPDTIFREGFQARGDNTDLIDHVNGGFREANAQLYTPDQLNAMNSAYVATTTSQEFIMDRVLGYFNWAYRLYQDQGVRNAFSFYEIQANDRMFSVRNSFIAGWAEGVSFSSIRSIEFEEAWDRYIEPPAGRGRLPQREWVALQGIPNADIRSVTTYSVPDNFFQNDRDRRATANDLIRNQTGNPYFVSRPRPQTSTGVREVHASLSSPGARVLNQAVGDVNFPYQLGRRVTWPTGIDDLFRGVMSFSCFGAAGSSSRLKSSLSSQSACTSVTLMPGSDRRIRPIGEYKNRHPCSP